MKKLIWILVLCLVFLTGKAQTGIGTTSPNPSAKLEVYATNKGFLPPRVTLTSATDATTIPSAAAGLMVYNLGSVGLQTGYYYWNGANWEMFSGTSFGDVKTGFQTADHSGWVKLDGRLKSTLTATQQTKATALGIGTNLPDATNAVLMQNGSALGSLAGSNTKTIAQANLPNVSFNGTAATAGDHSHSIDPPNTSTTTNGYHSHSIGRRSNSDNGAFDTNDGRRWENSASTTDRAYYGTFETAGSGNHSHTLDIAAFNSVSSGSHSHTVSVSSGGSGAALDITPRSLSVNTFIYLGY